VAIAATGHSLEKVLPKLRVTPFLKGSVFDCFINTAILDGE